MTQPYYGTGLFQQDGETQSNSTGFLIGRCIRAPRGIHEDFRRTSLGQKARKEEGGTNVRIAAWTWNTRLTATGQLEQPKERVQRKFDSR